jgi:transposase-like protein
MSKKRKKRKKISGARKLELVLAAREGPDSIATVFSNAGMPQQYFRQWEKRLMASAQLIFAHGNVLKQNIDLKAKVERLEIVIERMAKGVKEKARDDLEAEVIAQAD